MSMHRDAITATLCAAGVETGPTCSAEDQGGINHLSPVLDQRWCDSCGCLEITVVIYDELGIGEVVWAEQVAVYRPLVLLERHAMSRALMPDEVIDAQGGRP